MPPSSDNLTSDRLNYKDDGLTHRAILFLCGVIYPLWSVFLKLVLPHAYDSLPQRFVVGGVCLAMFFLVGKVEFFRARAEHFTHFMIFVLAAHYYVLAYFAQMSLIYVIGSLVVSCALSVLFFNRVAYAVFSSGVISFASIDVVLLDLHPDTSFMLMAGLVTVHVTFFFVLSARNRALNLLRIEQVQNAELRHEMLEMTLNEQRLLAKALEKKAHYDHLTEIANRTLFRAQLTQNISLARRQNLGLGLLFIDLDEFKSINDNRGHDAGDFVLREVAQRLRVSIRASDIPARLGGDEFTVILPNTSTLESARAVCVRIFSTLAEPFVFEGHTFQIGASIGIAILSEGDNEDSFVAKADRAMYFAKKSGTNQTVAFSEIDPSSTKAA